MSIDPAAFHHVLQFIAERVVSKNADDHGTVGAFKALGRPIHELHEVIKKGGFDLIFLGNRLGRGERGSQSEEP
jgi:nucleotide-binding universal stress UspA family protein